LKRAKEIETMNRQYSRRKLVKQLVDDGKLTNDDLYDRTKKEGQRLPKNMLVGSILRAEGYTDILACYLTPKPSKLGKRLAEDPPSQLAL